jgi:hypothetical protein
MGDRLADGNLYSIDTVNLLLSLPATKVLIGATFLARGLVNAVQAVKMFNAEGPVPFNRASNMGAAMFCALNVAVFLFLGILWISAISEFLSLSDATLHYANAYVPLVLLLVVVEVSLLAFVYRGLWVSIEKNGNGLSWLGRIRQFHTKGAQYHKYVKKRGTKISELIFMPLGAAGFVSATFWLQLFQ